MPQRVDYGIDAPGLMRGFLIGGTVAAAAGMATSLAGSSGAARLVGVSALLLASYLFGMGGYMLYESRIGKVRGRDRILDQAEWRGDEQVLDVGCGRGLLLIGAAHRLTSGKAIGIDIWRAKDQSGASPEGAAHNAAIEGVAERIAIETGDMRQLPFADSSFDLVMSHWVVHNLEIEADRVTALGEMKRVLRPGGRLLLTDIANRKEYRQWLDAQGFKHVRTLVSPIKDVILAAVSFGSFRPATIVAVKPA